jgi:methylase of polypeptide subunit release factors
MRVTFNDYKTVDIDSLPINEEWDGRNVQENLMHRIHAYPAKFPAFITTKAIEYAESQNVAIGTVADIFCGCGTVAYETVKANRHFWGCDINPVATLIARTKSHHYDSEHLTNYYEQIVEKFYIQSFNEDDAIANNERVKYWFFQQQIEDLSKLKQAIETTVDNEIYRDFFLCAFSNILKSCSRWLTKSIKPQLDPNKKPHDVMEAFATQVKMMRKANLVNEINGGLAVIETTNCLSKTVDQPFVDLLVTSPPYVTSYEYADLHQLSTLWLGYTNDYRSFRNGTIGSLHGENHLPDHLKHLNDTGKDIVLKLYAIDKSKCRSVSQYYIDMQNTVKKAYELIRPGGATLFVIGNTEYKGVKIDNARHLIETLLDEGFENVEVERRKISNKILTPYRDSVGKFTTDKNSRKIYSEEFIIFAKKPLCQNN